MTPGDRTSQQCSQGAPGLGLPSLLGPFPWDAASVAHELVGLGRL